VLVGDAAVQDVRPGAVGEQFSRDGGGVVPAARDVSVVAVLTEVIAVREAGRTIRRRRIVRLGEADRRGAAFVDGASGRERGGRRQVVDFQRGRVVVES